MTEITLSHPLDINGVTADKFVVTEIDKDRLIITGDFVRDDTVNGATVRRVIAGNRFYFYGGVTVNLPFDLSDADKETLGTGNILFDAVHARSVRTTELNHAYGELIAAGYATGHGYNLAISEAVVGNFTKMLVKKLMGERNGTEPGETSFYAEDGLILRTLSDEDFISLMIAYSGYVEEKEMKYREYRALIAQIETQEDFEGISINFQ